MIGVATCSIRVAQGRDVLLLVAAPYLSLLPNSVFQIHETAMAADAARWQQYFRDAPPQPGDEQVGERPHAQLVRMDNRFRASCAPSSGARRAARPQSQRMTRSAGTSPLPSVWCPM